MYDQTNGAFLVETLLTYYMSGFNVGKTAVGFVYPSEFPAVPPEEDRRNIGG